jgi:hypothetical protein
MATLPTIISAYSGSLFEATRLIGQSQFRLVLHQQRFERALRPSVIFRKVTGCFRSHWGARLYAATASVIATGQLHGKSALEAIRDVLFGCPAAVIP